MDSANSATAISATTPAAPSAPVASGGAGPAPAQLTLNDARGLLDLVRGIVPQANGDDGDFAVGVRDLPGAENNLDNPAYGAAGEPFLRLTEARYGAFDPAIGNNAVNPIFAGLDPRAISDIIGTQEAGTPQDSKANIFLMAFGQYFDHGLSFIPKGGNGTIQIGDPGAGRTPTANNPADLTRATVVGLDADGTPQHMNITSPYVDQNQVYGSSALIGQLLRESDGNGGMGIRVLLGAPDPSADGFFLLPTLRDVLDHHIDAGTVFQGTGLGDGMTLLEYYPGLRGADGSYDAAMVRALAGNFMGEGWPILLDTNPFINLLDHIVAGDGRVNENVTLTSMHTIFARNHNLHADQLAQLYAQNGIAVTAEELFQAAKIVNEAEYQRVVFTEFAEAVLGGEGIRGTGDHGFDSYVPETDARITHEFAAAVYRFGHTMIGQTVDVLQSDGSVRQVALFDAFLNPTNTPSAFSVDPDGPGPAPLLQGDAALEALATRGYVPQEGYTQLGAAAVLGGIVAQPSEAVDVNIVEAVRNDLVRISADLFAFNVARGRDLGIGTLNQVRMDLSASTDPYIRAAVGYTGALTPYADWDDFQDRNSLSDAVIAQFRAAYPDLVLSGDDIAAFAQTNPDIAMIDNGDGTMTVKGIDRVDLWVGGLAEAKFEGALIGATFWVVMHEQMDRLQEGDRFYYIPRLENFDLYGNFVEGQSFADIVMRTTGLTGLDERIFELTDEDGPGPSLPPPPVAPRITSSDAVSLAEGETDVMTARATDAQGDALTFALAGTDAALFAIDAQTGAITFRAAPDFEGPADADGDNRYDLQLSVSDGTNTTVQALAVTVTDVNEAAMGEIALSDDTPRQGARLRANLSDLDDPEGPAAVAMQWQRSRDGGQTWEDIAGPGATQRSYVPGADDLGAELRLAVTVTDVLGGISTVYSAATGPTGGNFAGDAALADTITGTGGDDRINGLGGDDLLDGAGGDDTVNGGGGADTVHWATGGGRDLVAGGGNGAGRDRFVVTGSAAAETFAVYAVGGANDLARAGLASALGGEPVLALTTEIVVTLTVDGVTRIIAELDGIEEITINTLDPLAAGGGTALGDTVQVIGDFGAGNTSLDFRTIRINGSAGDDIVDIGGLASAHRVVLQGHGGQDAILGGARGQDVVITPDGSTPGDAGDVALGSDGDDRFVVDAAGPHVHLGLAGDDTIDFSALDQRIVARLAPAGDLGLVQAGDRTDWLDSVENIVGTRFGDAILAGDGANVMTGGAGRDTYHFQTAQAAHGDVITDFAPGDRINLRAIDADAGTADNQTFTLQAQGQGAAAGLLAITEVAEGVYRLEGHVDGDGAADFQLTVHATRPLTGADILL